MNNLLNSILTFSLIKLNCFFTRSKCRTASIKPILLFCKHLKRECVLILENRVQNIHSYIKFRRLQYDKQLISITQCIHTSTGNRFFLTVNNYRKKFVKCFHWIITLNSLSRPMSLKFFFFRRTVIFFQFTQMWRKMFVLKKLT